MATPAQRTQQSRAVGLSVYSAVLAARRESHGSHVYRSRQKLCLTATRTMWRTFSRFEEASTDVPGDRLRACMPRMGVIILATGVRYGVRPTTKSGRFLDRDTMVQHGGRFQVLRRRPPLCRAHARTITSARACRTWASSFWPRACATARTPRQHVGGKATAYNA